MIYTVTLNPSIDYVAGTPTFRAGALNRLTEELFLPGGKGNNVSVVLKNLGVESTALGFIAGFTGEQIDTMLRDRGIRTDFIRLSEGNSRINMKILSIGDGVETEVNGGGPVIRDAQVRMLVEKLGKLKENDTLILAGSVPPTLPDTIYEKICRAVADAGVKIVVDAEKKLLERILKYRPFLVKPNHHELGQMFDVKIRTKDDALFYGARLKEMGARNVIVSLAGDGAVFLGENGERFQMVAQKGKVVNSVGAGDSMIAGFLAAIESGAGTQAAFAQAVCCGSACAFMKGLPGRAEVESLLAKRKEEE